MIRSLVSIRVVYLSRGKPWNSLPVDFSTTRSLRPAVTWVLPPIF